MGQAAFLSKNLSAVPISFYASIPGQLNVNAKNNRFLIGLLVQF